MTAEVAFAQSFLTTLDSKPVKLQSDYAVDLKTLELTGPYTLPRMPKPMRRPDKTTAPGSDPGVTVSLKSLRNPPLDISLPAEPLSTTILELKQRIANEIGAAGTDKIRLLYAKKPCADSKTIKDVIGEDAMVTTIEISVMIMGGSTTKSPASEDASKPAEVPMEDAPVAQGESGSAVLDSTEFWSDLQGFLEQRIRSKEVAQKASKVFADAWKGSK